MAKTGPAPTKAAVDSRIEIIKAILDNVNLSAEYKLHLISELLA